VAAGDPRPDFLTVGTYPGEGSFGDLKRAATRERATGVSLDQGGLVVLAARNAEVLSWATRAGSTRSRCSRP
jgi:hypothetical protein